jgi:hypothetical protein
MAQPAPSLDQTPDARAVLQVVQSDGEPDEAVGRGHATSSPAGRQASERANRRPDGMAGRPAQGAVRQGVPGFSNSSLPLVGLELAVARRAVHPA